MIKTASTIVTAALIVAYPILVYTGLLYFEARFLALFLILIGGLRFALLNSRAQNDALPAVGGISPASAALASLAILIVLGFVVAASNNSNILRYYPVCMNGVFLNLFAVSWLNPPTMIERFARIKTPNLSERAIRYTANVTLVWCVFFVVNGLIALATSLWATLEIWTLYNGFISYLLMAILFLGEYLVRRRVQKQDV